MERHGFVTFWLIFTIVVSGIFLLVCSFLGQYLEELDLSKIELFFLGLSCVLSIASAVLLLHWRISGFWLLCANELLGVMANTLFGNNFLTVLIAGAIRVLIFYGILRIKKNGVSAWAYLMDNNGKASVFVNDVNKKCRNCGDIYPKLKDLCPKCGSALFEETSSEVSTDQGAKFNHSLDDNSAEKKKCSKCHTMVLSDLFKCPKCKSESFT